MLNDPSLGHRNTWELIPWLVNGTASESERQIAEAHIRGCEDCGEELRFQQQLRDSLAGSSLGEAEGRAGWQLLRARLNDAAPEVVPHVPARESRARRPAWTAWLVAAVIVQAVGLGALGLTLAVRSAGAPAADYRTLSAPEAALPAGSVRAVFAAQTTLAELQALLTRSGLRVLSGPGAGGVWTLTPRQAQHSGTGAGERAARVLRADPQVRFAVAVGGSL